MDWGGNCDEEAVKLLVDLEQLLAVFPEYVWRKILKEVTDPRDLESLCNASLYFRGVLGGRRTEFLFGKVLDVLVSKYSKAIEDREYGFLERPNLSCGACGSSRYRRTYSSVINLRLVCRSWCWAVDRLYEGLFDFEHDDEASGFGMVGLEFNEDEEDEFGEAVGRFENHFSGTHEESGRNPFIGRKVELSFYGSFFGEDYYVEEEREREYFVERVLRKYGGHVWYCDVWFDDVTACGYSEIREWLELMPNLRSLSLTYSSHNRYIGEEVCHGFDENLLEQEIEANGLPVFKDLRCFSSSQLPHVMFNEILRKNGQLEAVFSDDICEVEMPMLKEIKCSVEREEGFVILESPELRWPMLSKLNLEFGKNEFFEWSRVFGLISRKWGGGLKDLSLVLPKAWTVEDQKKIVKECGDLRLELPRVKVLCLDIGNYSSLDFIMPMVGIEDLCINVRYELEKKSGVMSMIMKKQVVQFYGYHQRLGESNFWELFPVLSKIRVNELLKKDGEPVYRSWDATRREAMKGRSGSK